MGLLESLVESLNGDLSTQLFSRLHVRQVVPSEAHANHLTVNFNRSRQSSRWMAQTRRDSSATNHSARIPPTHAHLTSPGSCDEDERPTFPSPNNAISREVCAARNAIPRTDLTIQTLSSQVRARGLSGTNRPSLQLQHDINNTGN